MGKYNAQGLGTNHELLLRVTKGMLFSGSEKLFTLKTVVHSKFLLVLSLCVLTQQNHCLVINSEVLA